MQKKVVIKHCNKAVASIGLFIFKSFVYCLKDKKLMPASNYNMLSFNVLAAAVKRIAANILVNLGRKEQKQVTCQPYYKVLLCLFGRIAKKQDLFCSEIN